MTDKSEAYLKLAEAVEALEGIDLEIETAEVEEVVENSHEAGLMAMMGREPDEQNVYNAIHIVARVGGDEPLQEVPDDPDGDHGVEIDLGPDEEETEAHE